MEHVPHPLFLKLALAFVALALLAYPLTRSGPEWKPPFAKVFFTAFAVLLTATLVSFAFDSEGSSWRSHVLLYMSLFPAGAWINGARRMERERQEQRNKPSSVSPVMEKGKWRRRERTEEK